MSLFRKLDVSLTSILRLNFLRGVLSVLLLVLAACTAKAQQGDGTIQGMVTDPSGAVLPNATVTITNVDTNVSVKRVTNSSGDFNASPLQAGKYLILVDAKGFKTLVQENVTLDALQTLGINLKMVVGSASEEVTITDAPPMLDTQDASLGGTVENELYTDLPLSMNGGPRDPSQFQYLMPGVSEGGGTTGVFGGSGQEYLNQNYINGIPVSSIASQGDPTTVRNAVSVDAVDQFQVKTNGAGVAFGGAGVTNYTIKSGGNQLHGTVFDYTRNTMFDAWGYFSKVPAANGYAIKPGEHQDSFGGSVGGPILKDKLFFFAAYEGFHYTKISNTPEYLTIPTMRERAGDFTDAFGTGDATQNGVAGIFDPILGTARKQFQGSLNGAATYNVIPDNEISSISKYLMQALPAPTNLSTSNNYLAGLPFQNDDYRLNGRLDYTLSQKQKLSIIGLGGLNGYNKIPHYNSLNELPLPYAAGLYSSQKSATGIITHTFVINERLINTFNYGLTRTWGESYSPTDKTIFSAGKAGIENTPAGSATNEMPSVTFSGGSGTAEVAPTGWASNLWSGPQATNSFTITDNLLWVKGRHNWTFGVQMQWLETNAASYGGYSGATQLTYSGYNTENLANTIVNNETDATKIWKGGSAFASFLVGAVYTGNVRTQTISDVGGRFKPIAPYVQDSWRVTSKLTVTAGLRYDYLQPWHEAKNRFAYVNPNVTNPITGNLGVVFYGGYGKGPNPAYSPYICQCSTPIHPYNKNFEPQLAVAYSPNRSMVIRANFGVITTHAGGTGGHANATSGPGNNSEYAFTNVWQGSNSTSPPAFFLNPGIQGTAQNSLFPPGQANGQADYASIPPWTAASNTVNPLSTTGNYNLTTYAIDNYCPVSNQLNNGCNPTTQNFVDLYYGGRGPQFVNYNIGIQQEINKQGTFSINYSGSQTHFLPGGTGRGYATNSIQPEYGALLGSVLGWLPGAIQNSPSTLAAIQQVVPNYATPGPYANYGGNDATLARALSAFPQFGNLADIWGATGNSNYNALQVTYVQRPWHGFSGFANYTWSKSIDDVGQHRTQYSVSPTDGNFGRYIPANAVDRGLGTYDQRQNFNATFNLDLPFGRGRKWLTQNKIGGLVAGGWSVSGIIKLRQGFPLQINMSGYEGSCETSLVALQGTCMPDYSPSFTKSSARIHGKWGRAPGANASNIQTIQYIDINAFQCPSTGTTNGGCGGYKLGNVARSAPYGLRGPGWKDMDMGFRRTFNVVERPSMHLSFQMEADVANITNSTFFTLASGATSWGACTAGQTTLQQCSAMAFGTIGGQNSAVPPRDWQFAGRFRF
jgi:hypothetical protein